MSMDAAIWLSGLLSFLPPQASRPDLPPLPTFQKQSRPLVLAKAGQTKVFPSVIHDLGTIPDIVKEYGTPALHVQADGVVVKGFAWRGSMEGVHVGSQPFNAKGMRQRHKPIRVTLERLWCDDVGEDAISIQPRAKVVLKRCYLRGNWGRVPTKSDQFRGLDKLVQIDGAEVTFEDCVFHDAAIAVMAKANSKVTFRRCQFINCHRGVIADGDDNPRPSNPYDNGLPGTARVTLVECEAWDTNQLVRAHRASDFTLVNCRAHRGWLAENRHASVKIVAETGKEPERTNR